MNRVRANLCILVVVILAHDCCGNPDAKRLYDDLMNGYNSIIRPVSNISDRLVVKMGIRLSQLIDVNMKSQILSTNVWVEQEWTDYKLKWEPEEYGGVTKLHVPSEQIWLPDIVLYNNADGNYEINIMTKAILHYDGLVVWKPPAIYKSSCAIDVEYFPFDEQTCFMKFGTWTHDGYTIDLKHIHANDDDPVIEMGMDLSEFYLSVEWDIMAVPARRKVIFYSCCEQPYIDITFNLTLRRKTLFYTFNLIIPCLAISFLSILVFYLPSDSGEKVSLSISIMLSLVVFFLLLAEIIPPTSLTVPLLGKFLLFTMILVTLSVVITIAILNVNFRSPDTHRMSPWVRRFFIDILPNFLFMQRPNVDDLDESSSSSQEDMPQQDMMTHCKQHFASHKTHNKARNEFVASKQYEIESINRNLILSTNDLEGEDFGVDSGENSVSVSPELMHITSRIQFLSQHKKNLDNFIQIEEDWKFVAMVLDRLFLWIFTVFCVVGGALIILRAPTLYDSKKPIDVLLTKNTY